MPLLAVCRHPQTGHVSAEVVNPILLPDGMVPGTTISCATRAEVTARTGRLSGQLVAARDRQFVNQSVNRSGRQWSRLVARMVASGLTQQEAEDFANGALPSRSEVKGLIVQIDSDATIQAIVAAEVAAHPPRGNGNGNGNGGVGGGPNAGGPRG